jgi:predicted secreted protein
MAFLHGKSSFFSIDNAAGSPVDISAFCEEVSLSRSIETAETTTFGSSAKSYIVGLTDATVSISGKFDAAGASTIDPVLSGILGQSATVTWAYRASSASKSSTNPEYTGEGIVTSYEVSGSVGDAVTFSAEVQVTGVVTRSTS